MNLVSREIVEAQAQVQARHRQIAIAQQAVERATASFQRNLLRVHDLQGLPIETLQSIQALDQARREYLRALVDYNAAQFRLQAIGFELSYNLLLMLPYLLTLLALSLFARRTRPPADLARAFDP